MAKLRLTRLEENKRKKAEIDTVDMMDKEDEVETNKRHMKLEHYYHRYKFLCPEELHAREISRKRKRDVKGGKLRSKSGNQE